MGSIDNDTSVVPRGAFVIDQADNVSKNVYFEGLTAKEAGNLSFFNHFRPAQEIPKKTLLERNLMNDTLDFLDRLDEDIPKGCWSLQFGPTGDIATLRSLVWPGYVAYHVPGTTQFGGMYVGNGEKNIDIGFML